MAETYEIVSQLPRTRIDPGGTPILVTQVTFVTKPSGQPGQVDIPTAIFTPDEVDRVVAAKAAIIEAVQAL